MPLDQYAGIPVRGVRIDEHRFVGALQAAQLFKMTIDPRRTEDLHQRSTDAQLESVHKIRVEVQRLFEGAKKKNVESYAKYIVDVHAGLDGMAPPIVLYTEHALKMEDDGLTLQVPWDVPLVAIDGETQLAARFEAANIDQTSKTDFVPVLICHGHPLKWARQVFHDLNLLAVRPNAALGLSMDNRDPITFVVRQIEQTVPFFRKRVNTVRRQLRGSDPEVLTITALRNATVTLAKGIGGVQFGTRPVPVEMDSVKQIQKVAIEWFTAVTGLIGSAIENRVKSVASASSVMAAIGAVGHPLVDIVDDSERAKKLAGLLEVLRPVRWDKGKTWEGIAGKFTPNGNFSIAGAKDTSYAVYEALTDTTSEGYSRIRGTAEPDDVEGSRVQLARVA